MHIPDSMLSPSTCAACGVAMAPVWFAAASRVKRSLKTREVPLLALGAAFSFTIMMFNIPALGGTTAHPVAGTLLAVMLGPWAAVIGISVALAIQALFFGDGGVLAFGANCFTMAFALPLVGYAVYLLLSRGLATGSRFRPLCAGAGAYAGINAAAALTAVLLGIQPALFHEANGHAIYFPFGLAVTLPAMLSTHLLIAGPAEAIVTALAVAYLQSASIPLHQLNQLTQHGKVDLAAPSGDRIRMRRAVRYDRLWVALGAVVALTPLGLLATGDAWGEWDSAGVEAQLKKVSGSGYVPRGIAAGEKHGYKGIGPLTDYGSAHGRAGYLAAALVGAAVIVLSLTLAGAALARREGMVELPEGATQTLAEPGPAVHTVHKTGGADGPLPLWLLTEKPVSVEPEIVARRTNRYVARSVADLARRCSAALGGETWPSVSGLLQRVDARAKLLGLLALIAVASASHHLATLALIYAGVLVAAHLSRLPLSPFVKRVWLAVPLFVGGVTLPVMLNTVTPGRPVFTIWHVPYLAITWPGVLQATLLVTRVGVTVSLAALLGLTTHWSDLMSALRALFVPRLFVDMLAMTYRYAILLMNTASEIFVARSSRSVGHTSNTQGRQFVGAGIGSLFGKTLALSEEVHGAMVSRGFTGNVRTLRKPVWRLHDSIWLGAALLLAITALLCDRWMGAVL